MSREKELIKNTIVLGLGKFLPKIVSIITLPILTARLTKMEYGTYDLIMTLVMLLIPVATLQIQSAAFRFLIDYRNNREKSSSVITNIWFVTIPISVILSIIISVYYIINNSFELGLLIGLYFFADIMFLTISQVARGLSYNKIFSIASIIISLINMIGIVVTVQINNLGLTGVMFSLVVAHFIGIILIAYKINLKEYIDKSLISKKVILEMISYSWPMIPNNLSNWVLSLSDRFVIVTFIGIEANAVYAVANKIPNLLSIVQSVFVMAWQENAAISVKDEDSDKYYTKMFDLTFSIVLGATALLICFTPIIFILLIRGDYGEAYVQIPILMLGMYFYCMSAFHGGIYIAHKKTKSVGITTMVAAIINLLVDLVCVNKLGITAASISTLIAYFILYVYRSKNLLRFQKIDYNIKKQIICYLVIVIMLILCSFQNKTIDIINAIIGISLFVLLNYKTIFKITEKILKPQKRRKNAR